MNAEAKVASYVASGRVAIFDEPDVPSPDGFLCIYLNNKGFSSQWPS